MSTLLLRFAAPMQSWGIRGVFDRRPTELEPTRSGIVGMLACAMGIKRNEPLEQFQHVKIGVRIDQPGDRDRDFHMVRKYNEKTEKYDDSWITYRQYLFDAAFLVGVEAEDSFLEKAECALLAPIFPLSLGRRSCPPEGQLVLGVRKGKGLREALAEEPWIAAEWYRRKYKVERLRVVRDIYEGEQESYPAKDEPISFSQTHRIYAYRSVLTEWTRITDKKQDDTVFGESATSHNPMEVFDVLD